LNDLTHTAGADLLQKIRMPTLVVHSREDASVPFAHAEWSLEHIPGAGLCEAGITGHFYWVGPGNGGVIQRLVEFFQD
jgi:pimeloyl-ACP methyl ester carboxylesterase